MDEFFAGVYREIVNPLITVLALAAFLLFVWGVVQFLRESAMGGENKEEGKKHMVWGIVGLVIIFGAKAIINILQATVNSFGN